MARVKSGPTARRRHKKFIKMAKGYVGGRSRLIKTVKEAVAHAGRYAYAHRRLRKRDFRRLWIARINAGARIYGSNYSRLMSAFKKADIRVNRKMLAEMALADPDGFKKLMEIAGAISA